MEPNLQHADTAEMLVLLLKHEREAVGHLRNAANAASAPANRHLDINHGGASVLAELQVEPAFLASPRKLSRQPWLRLRRDTGGQRTQAERGGEDGKAPKRQASA